MNIWFIILLILIGITGIGIIRANNMYGLSSTRELIALTILIVLLFLAVMKGM